MEELVLEKNIESNNIINKNNTINKISENENNEENNTSNILKDIHKTVDDIEKEKKYFNSGNMDFKNNQAENLFTVQNAIINGGISFGSYNVSKVLQNNGTVNKEYDLSNAEQFAEFGETVKGGEQFAVAIILCVFEYVELDDLQDLKSKLLIELPKAIDEEGKEIAVYKNAYLSINSLVKTIKGEMVVLESGEHCLRLEKNRSLALKNLWQQFPEIRNHIVRWLLKVYDSFEYRTNFDIAQITAAFVNIFKLDFNASVNHFFPRLYSNPNKYWVLGFIALELYNDIAYHDKILLYVNKWAESIDSWLWKSALYVYANIKNEEEDSELDKKIKKSLINQYNLLKYDNLPYIGILLISSKRLRTLVASIFGYLINNVHNYSKKYSICLCYLEFLRYGYYLISPKITVLPLVACDKKQQLENLFNVLKIVLSRYDTRRLLFVTLESYLKEISFYNVEKKTINHIKAFFQILAESNLQFRNDIILFLKKCSCSLAKELEEFLEDTLPSITSVNLLGLS